jgi:hypothetical protein
MAAFSWFAAHAVTVWPNVEKEGMQKRAEATTRLRALQNNLNHLVLESNTGGSNKHEDRS